MGTMPIRIAQDLFVQAQLAGKRSSRSGAQQIDHWARIGRELESAPTVSARDVQRVLSGAGSYDELSEKEQALVRASWGQEVDERLKGLNLEEEFAAEGRPWIDADEQGKIVHRSAGAE